MALLEAFAELSFVNLARCENIGAITVHGVTDPITKVEVTGVE